MSNRRIWANITETIYAKFQKRCKREGRKVPSVFSKLVSGWANYELDLTEKLDYNGDQYDRNDDR